LAVITVFLWLSLIGFAPGADAHPAAHTDLGDDFATTPN
jgi:hypothetical protein